jgi:hypothetical protein
LTCWVFNGHNIKFDEFVKQYGVNPYGQPGLNICKASNAFHSTCVVFITHSLGWKMLGAAASQSQGFLGNVVGFVGGVGGHGLSMLIWLEGSLPLSDCVTTVTIT